MEINTAVKYGCFRGQESSKLSNRPTKPRLATFKDLYLDNAMPKKKKKF